MTPIQFAQALLKRLGMPMTENNVQALVAVQKIEGGHTFNTAKFNPMNTTQPMPGSVTALITPAHIQAYTGWDQGIEATARTLLNPKFNYKGILAALGRSAPPDETLKEWARSPWGWAMPFGTAASYQLYGSQSFPGGVIDELVHWERITPAQTIVKIVGVGAVVLAIGGVGLLLYGLLSERRDERVLPRR